VKAPTKWESSKEKKKKANRENYKDAGRDEISLVPILEPCGICAKEENEKECDGEKPC